MSGRAAALLAAASWTLVAGGAWAADPASTFSLSSRAAALAGASAATADPASAPLLNPAAAAHGDGLHLKLGYLFAHPMLRYNGAPSSVEDVHGFTLGLSVVVLERSPRGLPLRLALGLALHVPDRWLARIYLVEPTRPSFVMWEGPVQRMVANPVVALRVSEMFSVGAGATLLADGAGSAHLVLGYAGTQTRTDAALDLELRLRAAPLVSVTVEPIEQLVLAAGFTGELAMDMDLYVTAELDAPGLEGDALIAVAGTNDFTPATLWAAVTARPHARLHLHLFGSYVMWSRANAFFARTRAALDLGGERTLLEGAVPCEPLRDSWTVAAALEGGVPLPARLVLSLRAGYQYRPTPVPEQTGFTTYADSDVHVMSTGLGLRTAPERSVELALGFSIQLQRVTPRATVKDPDVFFITGFDIEGWVVATALDASLAF
jgi:long-subunit fatty acid transport protein